MVPELGRLNSLVSCEWATTLRLSQRRVKGIQHACKTLRFDRCDFISILISWFAALRCDHFNACVHHTACGVLVCQASTDSRVMKAITRLLPVQAAGDSRPSPGSPPICPACGIPLSPFLYPILLSRLSRARAHKRAWQRNGDKGIQSERSLDGRSEASIKKVFLTDEADGNGIGVSQFSAYFAVSLRPPWLWLCRVGISSLSSRAISFTRRWVSERADP